MIFLENHDFQEILKNTIFSTLESEKMLENDFFDPQIFFPKKYSISAPEWYIYIGHTSNTLASRIFWKTSNLCRNRASLWIFMKPMANEMSGISFSKKFEIFYFRWFFNVLYIFEHRPDPDFRKSRKIHDMLWFQIKWTSSELFFFKIFFLIFFLSI